MGRNLETDTTNITYYIVHLSHSAKMNAQRLNKQQLNFRALISKYTAFTFRVPI